MTSLLSLADRSQAGDEDFGVFEADTADEAIEVLELHTEITLVLTDLDMPGSMNGLKLAAFVRDRCPPIKIIVTSAYRPPEVGKLPQGSPFLQKALCLSRSRDDDP